MSDAYAEALLRVAVAQLCQEQGFTHTRASCVASLTNIARLLMERVGACAMRLATHSGRSSPTAVDVCTAFAREVPQLQLGLHSLVEYVEGFADGSEKNPEFAVAFPAFPVKRGRNGLPKDGEREEVTWPLPAAPHIPHWLPPFPHPRTYKHTPVFSIPKETGDQTSRDERAKRRRQVEEAVCRLRDPQLTPLSVVANYDAIRCQGSYVPAGGEVTAAQAEQLMANPFTKNATAVSLATQAEQTPLGKQDLFRYLKYSQDPIEAIEEVDKLRPVNLRETVEDAGRAKKIDKTKRILSFSTVLVPKNKEMFDALENQMPTEEQSLPE